MRIPNEIDRYIIEGRIGAGSYGIVYRARDPLLNRTVAIKEIYLNLGDSPEISGMLVTEAQAIGSLNHPNVTSVFDFISDRRSTCLVMELMDGNLAQHLEDHGPIDRETAIQMGIQICDGLEHAHQKNVLHNDLKPQNILLSSNGDVKITDFGLSRLLHNQKPEENQITGSPAYIAPELWIGHSPSSQSDIYSLGITLYELISGKPPYTGDTIERLCAQHLDEPLPRIQPSLDIRDSFYEILVQATAKQPESRFSNVSELKKALISISASVNSAKPNRKITYESWTKIRQIVRISLFTTIIAFTGLINNEDTNYVPIDLVKAPIAAISNGSPNTYGGPDNLSPSSSKTIPAEILIQSALVSLSEGRFDDSVKELSSAIERNIVGTYSETVAYYSRALAYLELREFDKAILDFNKSIEAEPQNPKFLYDRGKAYLSVGESRQSLEDFRQASILDPHWIAPHLAMADLKVSQGYVNEAFSHYQSAIDLDEDIQEQFSEELIDIYNQLAIEEPNNPKHFIGRGQVYEAIKDNPKALRDYSYASVLAPDLVEAYIAKGDLHVADGDSESAEKEYQKAVLISYEGYSSHEKLCRFYSDEGDSENAVQICSEALSGGVEIERVETLLLLASALTSVNRPLDALDKLDEVISLNPDNRNLSKAYREKADAYKNLGEDGSALDAYNLAVSLNPDDPFNYIFRGMFHWHVKDSISGIRDLNYGLKINSNPDEPRMGYLYMSRSFMHLDQGAHDLTEKDLNRAVALTPNDAQLLNMAAFQYELLGDYLKAMDTYNLATLVESNPEQTSKTFFQRGDLHNKLGQYEQAISDYNASIDLYTENIEAYSGRGRSYYLLERYNDAVADFEKSIDLGSENLYDYQSLANSYGYVGRHEEALTTFETTISIDPNNADTFTHLAYYYQYIDAYDEARINLEIAIQLDPQQIDALLLRAKIFSELSHHSSAIKDFSKVISLDPEYPDIYFERGLAYINNGQFQQGVDDLLRSVASSPDSLTYFLLGKTYAELNDHSEAVKSYTDGLELDADDERAYFQRGLSYEALGQTKEAQFDFDYPKRKAQSDINKYTEGILSEPGSMELFLKRGQAYATLNQEQKAIDDYNVVIDSNPGDNEVYLLRGAAFADSGLNLEAVSDYTKAILMDPEDTNGYLSSAYVMRGSSYIKLGSLEAANRDFAKAVSINPDAQWLVDYFLETS